MNVPMFIVGVTTLTIVILIALFAAKLVALMII